jgi:hypothetical protein
MVCTDDLRWLLQLNDAHRQKQFVLYSSNQSKLGGGGGHCPCWPSLSSVSGPLYLCYSTPCQISDRTAPDLNFLTTLHSQGRINVSARISCLEVLLLELGINYS